jgi:ankyrin repeat protein
MRLLFTLGLSVGLLPLGAAEISYEKDVKPILETHCYECHGASQQIANLRLDRKEFATVAGRGKLAIVPGGSERSLLYLRISGATQGAKMPPTGALAAEDVATIKAWIDQGAKWPDEPRPKTDWQPDARMSRLDKEIRAGNFAAVKKAVETSPDLIRARDDRGDTLLMQASLYAIADDVKWLLDHKPEVNAADYAGNTALLWSVEDAAKVRALLDAGADPNAHSADGRSLLYIALEQPRSSAVLSALADHHAGFAADRGQQDPLLIASRNGDVEGMKLIARQRDGKFPAAALGAAAGADCFDCVQLILAQGTTPKDAGDALRTASLTARIEVLEALIAAGADVNAKDGTGTTALMRACYADFGDAARVDLLLHHGADVAARDANGDTALKKARRKGGSKIVAMLENAGAKE